MCQRGYVLCVEQARNRLWRPVAIRMIGGPASAAQRIRRYALGVKETCEPLAGGQVSSWIHDLLLAAYLEV